MLSTLATADEGLAAARFTDGDGPTTRRELQQAVALARHGAWRLARRHGLAAPDDAAMASDLEALREEQVACWHARSRPGGLADSLARLR